MDEELPFENEPVPAVAMPLYQSAMCGQQKLPKKAQHVVWP